MMAVAAPHPRRPRHRLRLAGAAVLVCLCTLARAADSDAETLQLQRDWDAITTRAAAADGRLNDYFMELLEIALRQAGRPVADTALGVAEHLSRDPDLPLDYPAAVTLLARFEVPAPGEAPADLPGAAVRNRPQNELGLAGWYLYMRLRARCFYRAGRLGDAEAAARDRELVTQGMANTWRLLGPFGRHLDWAFDTEYAPEIEPRHAAPLPYAGRDFHWHPMPLDLETAGMNPALALEPSEGIGYARSAIFRPSPGGPAVQTVQILVWSTGPWKLKVVGADPRTAPAFSRDPGGAPGADMQLFEAQLERDQTYWLLAKLPATTRDFNVLFIDPRTRRPLADLPTSVNPQDGVNPTVRELPFVPSILHAATRSGPLPAGPLFSRDSLTAGAALRTAVAAYACGAYDQARYYLRPIAHQSAVVEYWYLLSFLDDCNELKPAPMEQLLALAHGAVRRDPGNRELQARLVSLDADAGNRAESRERLAALCKQRPLRLEMTLLQAQRALAWDPRADIEALLETLPDTPAAARISAGAPPSAGWSGHSVFYLPRRRLMLQVLLRDHRFADARRCLEEIIAEYRQGHMRHCLFQPEHRGWPPALFCPPDVVAALADLYLLAGQADAGLEVLFDKDPVLIARETDFKSPILAETIWRLRAAASHPAGDSTARDQRADPAWQQLLELHPDSPRLWRQLGDWRTTQMPPGDSGSAYVKSFRLDNRQLDLLAYLPNFSDRFAPGAGVPPPSLTAASADANPALPLFPGSDRRRAVYLTYLPQGDCLVTRIDDDRLTRTPADAPPPRGVDLARNLAGRVQAMCALLEIRQADQPPQIRRLHTGLTVAPPAVISLGLPLPEPTGDTTTAIWQVHSRWSIRCFEPEFPALQYFGDDAPGTLPSHLRILAAVPDNFAATVQAVALPPELTPTEADRRYAMHATDYGLLGTGGRLHDWRLTLTQATAPEPDAPPPARQPIHFAVGQPLTPAEIARFQFLPDRYRLGGTREIQEEADLIRRTSGVSGLRLLERLRQDVIEYVPVDRPDLPVSASGVLRTGIGSRAVLFLALARALQLPGITVAPAYLFPNIDGGIDIADRMPQAQWQDLLADPARQPRMLIVVLTDAGGEPRFLDLADHGPGDAPGIWLSPASRGAPTAARTRTHAPILYQGGWAVLAGPLPAHAPNRLLRLPRGTAARPDKPEAAPLYEVFDIQLNIGADNKAEMAVSASWSGPAAQQQLHRTMRLPQRVFDAEVVWKAMLSDFPLSARLPGAVMRLPGWYLLSPATQPQDRGVARLGGGDPANLVGGPAYNTFTTVFSVDGTAYAAPLADQRLRCFLPLRRLQLTNRWAPLTERRQPLMFTEWRMAREFVQIRAAGRVATDLPPEDLHFEFAPLISYDLAITAGGRQRWDATRTVRLQPGVVAPEDYPRFKKVLEQIAAADRTLVYFSAQQ